MKYRFRASKPGDTIPPHRRITNVSSAPRKVYRLRGRNTLRAPIRESIHWNDLFEIGMLPPPQKAQRKRRKKANLSHLYTIARAAALFLPRLLTRAARTLRAWAKSIRFKKKKSRPPKTIQAVPLLCGILCAAILVTALSACGILAIFFLPYHRPHTSVTIPNFVGSPEPHDQPSVLRLVVEYEYNPLVLPGTVIAQSPLAGVTRRVYGSDGFCTVLLRVSKGKASYVLEDLRGKTKRDAVLILTNQKIQSTVIEEFSDHHPAGTVLSTLPTAGQELKEGATVTLRISAGKRIQTLRVPNLIGLTEAAAHSLLHSGGFQIGTVTYRASSQPWGTIIDQTPSDHTEIEKGATVSYTVSTGDRYDTKILPDLYGMTQADAARALRDYGLVIGSCFPVASAAPKGTVITQNPLPGTPITSSTVSVDLYISS